MVMTASPQLFVLRRVPVKAEPRRSSLRSARATRRTRSRRRAHAGPKLWRCCKWKKRKTTCLHSSKACASISSRPLAATQVTIEAYNRLAMSCLAARDLSKPGAGGLVCNPSGAAANLAEQVKQLTSLDCLKCLEVGLSSRPVRFIS